MQQDLEPPMKRRSYGVVRVVLALLLVAIVEVWAKSHLDWPAWLRWSAYAVGAAIVRWAIPAPEWPGEDEEDDDDSSDDRRRLSEVSHG